MDRKLMKYENKERLKELDIINVLKKAIQSEEDTVCDYGAGSGIFTIEAAKMTKNTVMAMDMNEAFLDVVSNKAKEASLNNVKTIQVVEDEIKCHEKGFDLFILVTVLHEIKEIPSFVSKVKKVLKDKGRVLIIDFKRKETPIGPPISHRVSRYEATRHFFREEILLREELDLGDNFYMLLLENN